MLVILETTPPSPVPANARPQMVNNPPPLLQEKQGSYFLWLQAGFRSLCPLIYQRTAVLSLSDDQSPPPSVSPAQSLLYLALFSSIFPLQSPSFPVSLPLHLPYPPPTHSQCACCIPFLLSKSPGPPCSQLILSAHGQLWDLVVYVSTQHTTECSDHPHFMITALQNT